VSTPSVFFLITWSEPVSNFQNAHLNLGGSANPTWLNVSGHILSPQSSSFSSCFNTVGDVDLGDHIHFKVEVSGYGTSG
jgi:hypothetical protein